MIPEKVSGLEELAEANFPTPKKRVHIPAEQFEDAHKLHPALSKILENGPNQDLIVRSAHPREDEFSGGAFESYPFTWLSGSARVAVQAISDLRRRMVEAATPAHSLQIRRNLRHRGIRDFDPNEMGIFVNEHINPGFQITVVPLDDGRLAFRHLRYTGESWDLSSTVISEANVDHNAVARLERTLKVSLPQWLQYCMPNVKGMVQDAFKIQKLRRNPQELELVLNAWGEHVFVQTRTVEPESTVDDEGVHELFDTGVQKYFNVDEGYTRAWPRELSHESSLHRRVKRETTLLVVDVLQWAIDAGLLPRCVTSSSNWYSYIHNAGDPTFVPFRTGDCTRAIKQRDRLNTVLKQRYRELEEQAEEAQQYGVWLKSIPFLRRPVKDVPDSTTIARARDQIVSCGSVVIRGWSDYHGGAWQSSHHYKFGTSGPRQIGIYHASGGLTCPAWAHSVEPMEDRFKDVKTGAKLTVLFDPERGISLIPEAKD